MAYKITIWTGWLNATILKELLQKIDNFMQIIFNKIKIKK